MNTFCPVSYTKDLHILYYNVKQPVHDTPQIWQNSPSLTNTNVKSTTLSFVYYRATSDHVSSSPVR